MSKSYLSDFQLKVLVSGHVLSILIVLHFYGGTDVTFYFTTLSRATELITRRVSLHA